MEDAELGGARIAAGEGLIALNQSANRDAAVFEGARARACAALVPHCCSW